MPTFNLPVLRFGLGSILSQSEVVSRSFGRKKGFKLMVLTLLVALATAVCAVLVVYMLTTPRVLVESAQARPQPQPPLSTPPPAPMPKVEKPVILKPVEAPKKVKQVAPQWKKAKRRQSRSPACICRAHVAAVSLQLIAIVWTRNAASG